MNKLAKNVLLSTAIVVIFTTILLSVGLFVTWDLSLIKHLIDWSLLRVGFLWVVCVFVTLQFGEK